MARVKLEKGRQREFLNSIAKYFEFNWSKMAKISNISARSLRDWRREKYNMSYEALLRLQKIADIPIPKKKEILPEYWSVNKASRLGAIRRNELYGNPVGISLNSETDYSYALYIRSLIKELFNLNPSICHDRSDKSITVIVSSKNLVEFFIEKGLKSGDKVVNQVGIPKWIDSRRRYKIACLRGLMDTDGSFYSYLHRVNGKVYKNYALDFTNRSLPLLQGVRDILRCLGCTPTLAKYKVILNKKRDISRYVSEVGSSNPRREEKFISSKIF